MMPRRVHLVTGLNLRPGSCESLRYLSTASFNECVRAFERWGGDGHSSSAQGLFLAMYSGGTPGYAQD